MLVYKGFSVGMRVRFREYNEHRYVPWLLKEKGVTEESLGIVTKVTPHAGGRKRRNNATLYIAWDNGAHSDHMEEDMGNFEPFLDPIDALIMAVARD